MAGEPHGFLQYAAERLALSATDLPDVRRVNDAGNTFGAICVRLGLLTVRDIEDILDIQRNDTSRRFGAIALELGRLTQQHVDSVLQLQFFYRSFEQAALLVIDGKLELVRLGQFWADYAHVAETRNDNGG